MSSRQEEKERRKQERLAREQEIEKAERRRRLLGMLAGGVLAAAAIAAIVVAVTAGGGGSDDPKPTNEGPKVPIPAQKETDLDAAAKAADCSVRTFIPGANDREHVDGAVNYKQNPPVFGPHAPSPASDGNYVGQGDVSRESLVHALEHGRVVIWFKPALAKRRVSQLETLFAEPMEGSPAGYKQLLVENAEIPGEVAATGWGQQIICPRFTNATFDALRAFRLRAVDKGPENVPYPA